jgi:Tfp pilus assembly protein PilE
MSDAGVLWVARGGQKYGPYPEASVRQWLDDGTLSPDMLAWREGMAEWMTLSLLMRGSPGYGAPPPPPPHDVLPPTGLAGASSGARAALPPPPSLHWFVVFLLSAATLGAFGWVWLFVQSSWVRKIDQTSRATMLLLIALAMAVVSGVIHSARPDSDGSILGWLLGVGAYALLVTAAFSMAGSMRRDAASRGLLLSMGGVTLFVFHSLYLQGQMTWLARWKDRGQVLPGPPKTALWVVLTPIAVVALFVAITAPAYQSYVMRTQVGEGLAMADAAKAAVNEYYAGHGQLPANNHEAGLADASAIHGKYVASIEIRDGAVRVTFGGRSQRTVSGHTLIMTPQPIGRQIMWTCSSSGMNTHYLPADCR